MENHRNHSNDIYANGLMGYMQNFNANPMTHNKLSQNASMIKTNMQKKGSAAEAEPINTYAYLYACVYIHPYAMLVHVYICT